MIEGGKITLCYLRGETKDESEKKANKIKRGIRGHGHESPHGFPEVSHLTSAT